MEVSIAGAVRGTGEVSPTAGRRSATQHQIVRSDVVHLADVGVVERGNRPRLSLESLAVLGRQVLDRHDALEPGIEGLVDLAHATSANSRFDFVRAETCAGCEEHTLIFSRTQLRRHTRSAIRKSQRLCMWRRSRQTRATLTRTGIRRDFAQDLSDTEKTALVATQGPTAVAAFAAPLTGDVWRVKPSSYIVAKNDRTINPDLERLFASRMNAVTMEIPSSHVPMLS
jgi:hypothetical protein